MILMSILKDTMMVNMMMRMVNMMLMMVSRMMMMVNMMMRMVTMMLMSTLKDMRIVNWLGNAAPTASCVTLIDLDDMFECAGNIDDLDVDQRRANHDHNNYHDHW